MFNFSAETKYFNCQCVRCQDPTEMGTMFSSIRCPQCTVEQVCLGLTKVIMQGKLIAVAYTLRTY